MIQHRKHVKVEPHVGIIIVIRKIFWFGRICLAAITPEPVGRHLMYKWRNHKTEATNLSLTTIRMERDYGSVHLHPSVVM